MIYPWWLAPACLQADAQINKYFLCWCEIYNKVKSKQHLTKQGMDLIIELKKLMTYKK